MKVEILKDYPQISAAAASIIIHQVKENPNSVISLASGDTPRLALEKVVDLAKKEQIDFSAVQFIGLDEWVGISPEIAGSCARFFQETIFSPLKIPLTNIHLFNALAENLERECEEMDQIILSAGGIDLMVVGIGINGHIGFNEPGIPADLKSHVAELHETTRTVGQKYFKASIVLTKGITLGFQHLLDAKKVVLMANGMAKSKIVQEAIMGDLSDKIPASIMRRHPNGLVLLDEEAASSYRLMTNSINS